jgi:RNA polymerase sigma factor (sigma-70 family)
VPHDAPTDERLALLARAGSVRAFELIVVRHGRELRRYCARFTSDSEADDLVQETFIRAHGALTGGARVRNLRSWLYRIAHNLALNLMREPGRRRSETGPGVPQHAPSAQALSERRDRLRAIVAGVTRLPPRQREALVLHELEGRSYDEIAARLQVTRGAVRQLLSRARATLRAGE